MKSKLLIMFGLLPLWAAAANVEPAMFTNCPLAKTLKSPANGAGVYFSEDCSVAYVLPPKKGTIYLSQPTRTANLSTCPAVEAIRGTMELQSRKIYYLMKQIERAEASVNFDELKDPWFESGKNPPENLNPQTEELEKLKKKAMDDVRELTKFNEEIAQYEGPKVGITVSADHSQLVQEYQNLNKNIVFRPMPVARSVLNFVGRVDKNAGKAPAALYMDLAGLRVSSNYFTGISAGDVEKAPSNDGPILFSSAVSGQLVMSLVGACPFYDVKLRSFPERLDAKSLESVVRPTVDYVYNVSINRSYEASYNLSELFKRIQKQSTSGGFFSSKTLHSIVMEGNSDGWFRFKSLSQDPRSEWDKDLSQTLKGQIIDRLLARLGAKPVGADAAPGLNSPGKTGAEVASEGLKKCPNVYCQAAAYVLDFAQAAFGGKEAVSEFINTQNHWEHEVVSESKMVPQMGQTGFN